MTDSYSEMQPTRLETLKTSKITTIGKMTSSPQEVAMTNSRRKLEIDLRATKTTVTFLKPTKDTEITTKLDQLCIAKKDSAS